MSPTKSRTKSSSRKLGPRARLRKQVESGKKDPREVLTEMPAAARQVTVEQFLQWIPGVGADNAARVMRGVVFNPATKLGALTGHVAGRLANRIQWRVPGERAASRREA